MWAIIAERGIEAVTMRNVAEDAKERRQIRGDMEEVTVARQLLSMADGVAVAVLIGHLSAAEGSAVIAEFMSSITKDDYR